MIILLLIIWAAVIILGGGWVFLYYFVDKEQNEYEMMWGYVYMISVWLIPFFILTLLGATIITGLVKLWILCKPWILKEIDATLFSLEKKYWRIRKIIKYGL